MGGVRRAQSARRRAQGAAGQPPTRLTHQPFHSALVGMLGMVVLGACGRDVDPDNPYAREVAENIPKIERSTGLEFTSPPRLESQPRDSVRAFLERRFHEELPDEEIDGMERAYKALGLLPASMDLRRFMLDLLTEQVAGYYDPQAKTLYVVEGGDPSVTNVTIAHELVHALQDQHFNLDSLTRARGDNDRLTTGQTVVEGQATLEQIGTMIGSDNAITAMPGGWDRVRQMIRESQGSMPVFASAPTILQETLIFPYLTGAEFMRRFKQEAPGQSPFTRMPTSTEQLLHPERYFGSRDDPTTVTLPAPLVGTSVYENNLGEFETRILLYEYLREQASAVRGAAGWDGDRYMLIRTPRGDAIAWVTVWDTSIDAAEFFDLLDASMIRRHGGRITPGAGRGTTRTYGAGGRRILLAISDIGGRPVVLYADAPAGVSSRLIDLSRVTLQE